MGRATIVEDQGDGLYTVSIDTGSTQIDADIAAIQAEIDSMQSSLDEILPQLLLASNAARDATAALSAAIEAHNADEIDGAALSAATEEAVKAQTELGRLEEDAGFLRATISTLQGKLATLQAIETTRELDVWCTTFTEEAAGVVGTIEINGEKSPPILVPECAEWTAADGLATNPLAMSPSATYLNAAILPGWQKFSPTYRVGIISDIDTTENTCTVALDDAVSSAQGLDINQNQVLGGVPIEYLDCNAGAFEEGDRVVVKFESQSWNEPKVIGFESNPRPCGEYIWCTQFSISAGNVQQKTTVRVSQDLSTIVQEYQTPITSQNPQSITRINNSQAAFIDSSSNPLTTNAGRPLLKAPNGSVLFTRENTVPTVFIGLQMEVNKEAGRMYRIHQRDLDTDGIFETFAVEIYSWPEGVLLNTVNLPSEYYTHPPAFTNQSRYFQIQSLGNRVILAETHNDGGFSAFGEDPWIRIREFDLDMVPVYVGPKKTYSPAAPVSTFSAVSSMSVTETHILYAFNYDESPAASTILLLFDRLGNVVREVPISRPFTIGFAGDPAATYNITSAVLRNSLTNDRDEVIVALLGTVANDTPTSFDDVLQYFLARFDALTGNVQSPLSWIALPASMGHNQVSENRFSPVFMD